jgi:hypothetical protein
MSDRQGASDGRDVMILANDRTRVRLSETLATRLGAAVPPSLLVAMVLAAVVRLSYVLAGQLPLNDGAMFVTLVRDIQAHGFSLPSFTSYNAADLPFAYPPLPFYLTALLSQLTGWSPIDIIRVAPALVSLLTIPAFFALCRNVFGAGPVTHYAVLAFALLPMSFAWLIMGGGLTRAPGVLFAILAINQMLVAYRDARARDAALAALFCALTVLSHPENAWFAAYTIAGMTLLLGRSRRGLLTAGAVAAGTLLLSAPWWLLTLWRHGPSIFLVFADSGIARGTGLISLLVLQWTGEPLFPLLGALALLGLIVCLTRRHFWLPGWLALVFLLQQRGTDQRAALPLAMLIGIGFVHVLLPVLEGQGSAVVARLGSRRTAAPAAPGGARRWALPLATCYLLLMTTFADAAGFRELLSEVSPGHRQAMAWAAALPGDTSRFLLVTGSAWEADKVAEWFPVLARQMSVATVQGHEWSGRSFSGRVRENQALQGCAIEGVDCLDTWGETTGQSFTHVYVGKSKADATTWRARECCRLLIERLRHDGRYEVAFDNEAASIFRRRDQ